MMRHRLHYVGKNRDFEDLGQETITLADIATEEEDDMINPAAVVALKGNDGNEVYIRELLWTHFSSLTCVVPLLTCCRCVLIAKHWSLIGLPYHSDLSSAFAARRITAALESTLVKSGLLL